MNGSRRHEQDPRALKRVRQLSLASAQPILRHAAGPRRGERSRRASGHTGEGGAECRPKSKPSALCCRPSRARWVGRNAARASRRSARPIPRRPNRAGERRARRRAVRMVRRPGQRPGDRAAVNFHGGGFCSGSIVSHRRSSRRLVSAPWVFARLAVGYRLAPEHPCPAAFDDARAVRAALRDGGDRGRLHRRGRGQRRRGDHPVAGDGPAGARRSAARRALAAVSLDGPDPSPARRWTARRPTTRSIHRAYLEELRDALLPHGDAGSPEVSLLFADAHGLPPSLVQVGSAGNLAG